MALVNLQRRPSLKRLQRGPKGFGLPGATSEAQVVSKYPWGSRYVVAIVAAAVCSGLHLALGDHAYRSPFLVYAPGVVVSGIFGGFGPGLCATALSAVAAAFIDGGAGLRAPLMIFAMVGTVISYFSHLLHRSVGSLRGHELGFRAIVDGISDYAVFMLDDAGRVVSWNTGAERIEGYSRAEILGRHLSRFYPPEDTAAGKPERLLREARRLGSVHDEGWRVRKDGSRYWASVVLSAVKDENGDPIGFTKIARDLTERKRAEEAALRRAAVALRESEAKYRSLFKSIDEGFCLIKVIFDERSRPVDYRFLEVNPAFERQTGLTDATGKTMRELAPAHEAFWFETYGRVASTGEPTRFESQAAALHRWYDVFAWRFGGAEDGQVAVLFNDVSERKRRSVELEKAVEERTNALRRSVEELEAFSYTVSHDLRAPLRAIQGYAFLVLERGRSCLEPESVMLLERIEDSATRMDRLVKDVLLFSEIGRERPLLQPVELDSVVAHVVENYEGIRNARVIVDHPLGTVRGHETLLTQAVSNLIENAVKFVAEGRAPEVKVRSERRRTGWLRLVVEDKGIGIPAEHMKRLFSPFVRLAAGKYPGTGIGLAIVKKSVESMGGEVAADSTPGKGSAFWIDLPEAGDGR